MKFWVSIIELLVIFIVGTATSYASIRANVVSPTNTVTLPSTVGGQSTNNVNNSSPSQQIPSVSNAEINPSSFAPNESAVQSSSMNPGSMLSDSEITTQVQAIIMGDSSLLGANIKATTRNGNVTLEGTANTQKQVDTILKAAQSVYGVKSVTSTITVQSNPSENEGVAK